MKNTVIRPWSPFLVVVLSAIALSACSGSVPEGLHFETELDIETRAADTDTDAGSDGDDASSDLSFDASTANSDFSFDTSTDGCDYDLSGDFSAESSLGGTDGSVDVSGSCEPFEEPDDEAETHSSVELAGVVVAIEGGLWMVGDVVFLVTPETEVEGGIQAGDTVEVEADLSEDGTWIAISVELEDREEVEEVEGAEEAEEQGG